MERTGLLLSPRLPSFTAQIIFTALKPKKENILSFLEYKKKDALKAFLNLGFCLHKYFLSNTSTVKAISG